MALLWAFQKLYFNPRPPRGGRRRHHGQSELLRAISIHALREEGDPVKASKTTKTDKEFQSTPSARRATEYILCSFQRR